jgi:hypothetical protein
MNEAKEYLDRIMNQIKENAELTNHPPLFFPSQDTDNKLSAVNINN